MRVKIDPSLALDEVITIVPVLQSDSIIPMNKQWPLMHRRRTPTQPAKETTMMAMLYRVIIPAVEGLDSMFLGRAETGFLAYAGGGVTDVINCGGVVGRGGTTGGGLSSSAMDCCLSLTMMYCFYTSYFTTHSKCYIYFVRGQE